MNKVPVDFTKAVDDLCFQYHIDDINKADAIGQALASIKGCCAGNSIRWVLGGLAYAYAIRPHAALLKDGHLNGAVDVLKKLVELLEKRQGDGGHLNYNDMDCNLRGWHKVIDNECLTCKSLATKIFAKTDGVEPPQTQDCPRCKGTGIEPEFHDHAWAVHYDDHGNGMVFVVIENCIRVELHIRELPYNISRNEQAKTMKLVLESMVQDRYDHPLPLLRYRDTRDEGFILSLSYDQPDERNDPNHSCEASIRAINALETVVEHFPSVIESLEKGEEP